jgi:hypothetical protein
MPVKSRLEHQSAHETVQIFYAVLRQQPLRVEDALLSVSARNAERMVRRRLHPCWRWIRAGLRIPPDLLVVRATNDWRNIIAVAIKHLIDALASQSFNRVEFLSTLDLL